MLDKYDIKKITDQTFWSEKNKCLVTFKNQVITFKDTRIDLKKVLLLDEEIQKTIYELTRESMTKCRMLKRKSHAFGKDVFLLGKNNKGRTVWLEAPQWNCGWYWGFGYIETYTNKNNPANAKDINSHSHFSGLVGQQEKYDREKGVWVKGEYIHNVYNSSALMETSFTEKEGWVLSELFKEFYLLQDMAEYTHKTPAGCNLTTSPVEQDAEKMKEWHEHINNVMIPKITAAILEILSPAEEVTDDKV